VTVRPLADRYVTVQYFVLPEFDEAADAERVQVSPSNTNFSCRCRLLLMLTHEKVANCSHKNKQDRTYKQLTTEVRDVHPEGAVSQPMHEIISSVRDVAHDERE